MGNSLNPNPNKKLLNFEHKLSLLKKTLNLNTTNDWGDQNTCKPSSGVYIFLGCPKNKKYDYSENVTIEYDWEKNVTTKYD